MVPGMTSAAAHVHRLESLFPGLWATRPEYPFGNNMAARAFLLDRGGTDTTKEDNNSFLFYASSHIGDYIPHIGELGMPSHQLLTHRDEASKFCNVLTDSKVFCHEKERSAIEAKGSRVDETFSGYMSTLSLTEDVTAYHAPGHTPGVAIYHWKQRQSASGDDDSNRGGGGNGKGSVLFTGDTLYGTSDGKLEYAPLFIHPYDEKKDDFSKTLQLIRSLRPSYIVPGLSASEKFIFPYDEDDISKLQERFSAE